jgi:hypothetical protein
MSLVIWEGYTLSGQVMPFWEVASAENGSAALKIHHHGACIETPN